MDFLFNVLIEPWITILTAPLFFGEVVIGGILSGVMYSLVALGFVLIRAAAIVVGKDGTASCSASELAQSLVDNGKLIDDRSALVSSSCWSPVSAPRCTRWRRSAITRAGWRPTSGFPG